MTVEHSTEKFGMSLEPSDDPDLDVDAMSISYRAKGVGEIMKNVTHTGSMNSARLRGISLNIQALGISAFLFALITALQLIAAHISHSRALLVDCISMGVDALTYAGNIVVECLKRDGGEHVPAQLVVTAMSLSCLIYFTADAVSESVQTAEVCMGYVESEGEEQDVDGRITLAFALGGVIFDLICLFYFYRSHSKASTSRSLNMFTALLHVGADCLRSTSTTVMSVMILIGGYDSSCLDAYTSLFIGATIFLGAAVGVVKWVRRLVMFMQK